VEGVVRLGTPDDYATRFLPQILSRFALTHPLVQVDVACQPSRELLGRLAENTIDVALVTVGCSGEPAASTVIHREPLVWAGLKHGRAHERRPLPLAVSCSTCPWRMTALERLDRAGIRYRIAYTSEHYVGQLAAVLADLAVAPLPASVLTDGLARIERRLLPPLGFYEIELRTAPRAIGPAVSALVEHIVASFADGHGGGAMDPPPSRSDADAGPPRHPSPTPSRRAAAKRSGAASPSDIT
jgi:DNA-binding transcriptional LysR family regulator